MRQVRLLFVAVALPWPLLRAPAQSLDSAHISQQFSRFDTDSTPGCAIAVERRGEPLVARAYGMADLERGVRNTPATIFEAGSVSKQFVAASVITLAERGSVSLDDDVRKWFPELHDYGTTITIRHLLQHTSGLRDWGAIVDLEGWPRGTRTIDHAYVLAVIARQRGLNHAPGAAYSYTNSGYSLLAMLVERITGASLATFTQQELFAPLGMTHTSWRNDYARIVRGRAQAYAFANGQWRLDMPFENPYGHGGLLTTVGDLLLWNQALAERRVGTPGVAAIMETIGVLTDGTKITYGAGLVLDSIRGVREIGHSGSTAGYNTHLARYPASGVSAVVLCNAANAGATALLRSAVGDVAGFQPVRAPARPGGLSIGTNAFENASVTIPRRPMTDYVGVWVSDETNARWTLTADSVGLVASRHPGDRRVIRRVAEDRFGGFGSPSLRFERDSSGTVMRMFVTVARAVNVPFVRETAAR